MGRDLMNYTPGQPRIQSETKLTPDSRLLVIATAERHINIVNLTDPTRFFKTQPSPLNYQTRVISCFMDSTGWAVGSIEGRSGFQNIDPKNAEYVDPPVDEKLPLGLIISDIT